MKAKYHSRINLDVPPALREAVTERAERELISLSAYVRRALLAQLQRDGIEFEPSALSRLHT
jgi:predicted HicB family RNase H-like nuclease